VSDVTEASEAQTLVKRLTTEARWSPRKISEMLDNRVSGRTIHRWGKGEAGPGNHFDLAALRELVQKTLPQTPPAETPDPFVDDYDYDSDGSNDDA
jgi:hypothetical protein